jgi:hypothetical protein
MFSEVSVGTADSLSTWRDTCVKRMRIHFYTAIVVLEDLNPISKKTDRISVTNTTWLTLRQTVSVYHETQTYEL